MAVDNTKNNTVTNFSEKLSEQLLLLESKKQKYFLVGDFNVDLLKYNLTTPKTNFLNILNSVGCNAFIDKPTRVTSGTASCIKI
jgi:exonuclease III